MALLKGTLDVLVLKALSWGPMHAFEVATWLDGRSDGRLSVEDAALMQALHRMEERGLLAADWGITDKARRARYYRLTRAGRTHLQAETERVTSYVDALTTVLRARTAE
jgi:PadR family transcriptional regulator PadR